jgi:hypothetical protein
MPQTRRMRAAALGPVIGLGATEAIQSASLAGVPTPSSGRRLQLGDVVGPGARGCCRTRTEARDVQPGIFGVFRSTEIHKTRPDPVRLIPDPVRLIPDPVRLIVPLRVGPPHSERSEMAEPFRNPFRPASAHLPSLDRNDSVVPLRVGPPPSDVAKRRSHFVIRSAPLSRTCPAPIETTPSSRYASDLHTPNVARWRSHFDLHRRLQMAKRE